MLWILTIVAVALTYSAVVLGVATFARVLSWIPSAGVRRGILIGPVTVTLIAFACVTVLICVAIVTEVPDAYQKTPSLTILLTPPAIAFCVSVVVVSIRGFRAQPDVAYQPRAAAWPLGRVFVLMAVMFALFLFTVFLHDVELRWRLGRARAAAEATAAAMTPATVPDEDNAAIHYQRCVDAYDEFSSRRDFDEFEAAMTRLQDEGVDDGALKAHFAPYEPAFEHLRRGAECDKCRFADEYEPLDLVEGVKTHLWLFGAVRKLQQFAEYRASQQRASEALEVIRLTRRLEQHFMMDPRNRPNHLYGWLDSHARHTVEHLVTYCDDLPEEDTRETMAAPLPVNDICRNSARWNAARMQTLVADVYSGAVIPESFFQEHDPDQAAMAVAMGSATMRFLYARDDLAAIRSAHPFLDDPSLLETDGELVESEYYPRGESASVVGTMAAARRWANDAEMARRLSNIGLAAGLYRQRTGEWPSDLADIRKDCLETDLIDPVTGSPFSIANIRYGVIVYSTEVAWLHDKFSDVPEWWDSVARDDRTQIFSLFLGRAHKELKAAEARAERANDEWPSALSGPGAGL